LTLLIRLRRAMACVHGVHCCSWHLTCCMKRVLTLIPVFALIKRTGAATCPGKIDIPGYGPVALTNAGSNVPGETVGPLEIASSSHIVAHMNARTYFADACTEGTYRNNDYLAMRLLGKNLKYTANVSAAGCGCNAAFYLVSMKQNTAISSCNDYYCDANHVCGVKCAEVDIQEASKRAWHSTLHSSSDSAGAGGGFGGGDSWNGPRDFTSEEYGPGARCIDTLRPFDVMVSFPVDYHGSLKAMRVTLTQTGKNCPLTINLDDYHSMAEISHAVAEGMTPVISYWKSGEMLWMDGTGADGQGPCAADTQSCGESVSFYGFTLEDIEFIGDIDLLQPPKPTVPFLPVPSALPPQRLPPGLPVVQPPTHLPPQTAPATQPSIPSIPRTIPVTVPPIRLPPRTIPVTQPPLFLPSHKATTTAQETTSLLSPVSSSSRSSSSSSSGSSTTIIAPRAVNRACTLAHQLSCPLTRLFPARLHVTR